MARPGRQPRTQGEAAQDHELAEDDRGGRPGLAGQHPAPAERGAGEPLEHAVPPLEAGRDGQRGERRTTTPPGPAPMAPTAGAPRPAAGQPTSKIPAGSPAPGAAVRRCGAAGRPRSGVRPDPRRAERCGAAEAGRSAGALTGPPGAGVGQEDVLEAAAVAGQLGDRAGHGHPTAVEDVRPDRPAPAASSMACVVSTMLTPAARSFSSSRQVARRACGSMPAVGFVEEHQLGPADQQRRPDSRPAADRPTAGRYGRLGEARDVAPLDQRGHVMGLLRTGWRGTAAARRP